MAAAILNGVLSGDLLPVDEIWLSNRSEGKLTPFQNLGVNTTTDNQSVAQNAGLIIMAVKPQVMPEVVSELADVLAGKHIVSIAAGLSSSFFKERIADVRVACAMPNTPLQLGKGVTAIHIPDDFLPEAAEFVRAIFSCAGAVYDVPETDLSLSIPLSGSSPAFMFRFAGALADQAEKRGFDRQAALQMVAQTFVGAGSMLLESGKTDAQLIAQVCSPGGTTLAGLSAFDDLGFDELIAEAVSRCLTRAEELGK